MAFKLEPPDIIEIVEEYIGVSGGYLGDFSYKTHREFYPFYCKLNINPDELEGTTRERFIRILSTQDANGQKKILEGILRKYQFIKMSPKDQENKKIIFEKIQNYISKLGTIENSLNSLKLSELKSVDTAFNRYEAIKVLGEGGCGRVFLLKDERGNHFAAKFLNPDSMNSSKLKRFKNEVFFSLKFDHDNIIKIFDFGFIYVQGQKFPFYVMPYLSRTFKEHLSQIIDPGQRLFLIKDILDALEFVHTRSIWHRDLKPENILFDEVTGKLILSDFGIAHISEEICRTASETKDGARLANFKYASPEQRMIGGVVDHRSDIYSLGLIMNEMFTGEVPWGAGYKKIADVVPELVFLDPIIEKMIMQSPDNRTNSIADIKKSLGL